MGLDDACTTQRAGFLPFFFPFSYIDIMVPFLQLQRSIKVMERTD